MTSKLIVVGAGIGGLAAALRLARAGFDVELLEAREATGGLAGGIDVEGYAFDAGPYVLLDRPGIEWAFAALGLDAGAELDLLRVESLYAVAGEGGPGVSVHASLEATCEGMEERWPGSGATYARFVCEMEARRRRLEPLLRRSRPTAADLLAVGAWRDAAFLLRSLAGVLDRSGLPGPVREALAIWTHVAAQRADEAPSPMAFVPALIHGPGPFVPREGMRTVARALERAARAAGVSVRFGARVRRIRSERGRVTGVELARGDFVPATAVVSGAHGVGTCLELSEATPSRWRHRLATWPLQSPGACAYLAVRGVAPGAYLRFRQIRDGMRLLVLPSVLAGAGATDWSPARLVRPLPHAKAERLDAAGQDFLVREMLDEPWWHEHVAQARVLHVRRPSDWGREHLLWRDSMNPVMTARLMRRGRLPHRAPGARGLYLCGSSTHPGQWVSFCAISGVLAANLVVQDLR